MKKLLCLFALILSTLTLSAAIYESNVLMQRLSLVDEIPADSYYIVEEGNVSILYSEEGEEVERVTLTEKMEERITSTSTVCRYFEDGTLICEEEITENGTVVTTYEYSENGNLKRVIKTDEDGNESIRVYNYSSLGSLSSFFSEDAIILFSATAQSNDGAIYSYDDARAALLGELNGATRTEKGYITTETTGFGIINRVYDDEQRLLSETWLDKEENVLSDTYYHYDEDGVLFFSRKLERGLIEDSYYVDGVLIQTVLMEEGEVLTVNSHLDDGTISSLRYRDGQPYARIHYERDANRVLELEIL